MLRISFVGIVSYSIFSQSFLNVGDLTAEFLLSNFLLKVRVAFSVLVSKYFRSCEFSLLQSMIFLQNVCAVTGYRRRRVET